MADYSAQTMLLKQFVSMCKANPGILHQPEFAFYKEYLESLGAKLPDAEPEGAAAGSESKPTGNQTKNEEPMAEEEEEPDAPLELDESGVIQPEADEPLPMGDEGKEASEEDMEKANDKRSEAMQALGNGDAEAAVKLFTEAIVINPGSALLHAKRASALLQLSKPLGAIRDCDKAIAINPDSATAYKFRGRANRLLGNWVVAHRDLATACKLDYDDTANEWMKEVEPNAKKIHDHEREKERRKEEKLLRERQERVQRAREEHKRAQEEQEKRAAEGGDDEDGEGGPTGFADIFSDPEILKLLQDPEVMKAVSEIMENPTNINKYLGNEKVLKVFTMLQSKTGARAPPGGPPGGFPFGSFGAAGGDGGDSKADHHDHPEPPHQPDVD